MDYDIYLDSFFILNFILDLLILKSTTWILSCSCSWRRLFLSAGAGALTSIFLLFWSMQSPISVPIPAVVMVLILIREKNVSRIGKYTAVLYFLAFCMEGAIRFGGFGTGVVLVPLVSYWIGRERKRRQQEIWVELHFHGKKKVLTGFYDSGNRLTEPLTGKMVHIACYEDVKELLPEAYRQITESFLQTGIFESTKVTELQMYEFTFLSYHSLGNETGQLLGIRMDLARFRNGVREKTEEKAVIGLTNQKLFVRGHSRMIMNGRLEL